MTFLVGYPYYQSRMYLLGLQLIIISLLVIHHDNNSYALALASPSQRKRSSGGGFGSRRPQDGDSSRSKSSSGSKSSNNIELTVAKSFADIQSFADLRYQEWIVHGLKDDYVPSRPAFRMATAEIHQERSAEHAVTFLARLRSVVVGAAELSPIELQRCFGTTGTNNNGDGDQGDTKNTPGINSSSATTAMYNNVNNNFQYWYVTDVVTARTHRRMGVAKTIMEGLEQYADKLLREEEKQHRETPGSSSSSSSGTMQTVFLLHVKPDNEAALSFYHSLGYKVVLSPPSTTTVDDPCMQGLNVDQLEENAGVEDQYLLSKTLAAAQ